MSLTRRSLFRLLAGAVFGPLLAGSKSWWPLIKKKEYLGKINGVDTYRTYMG